MLRKIFGRIRMTWPRLIIFAVISGTVTALAALLIPEGSSFRQIAVTFEAWIVLAIIVIVNCEKPLEAACKCFVYFLISQPLVYLIQVPFNSLGFGLFRYYYPYWFCWTLATFPGAFIAWFIKKDNLLSAVILSAALAALILLGTGYMRDLLAAPPRYLAATLFCFLSVPVLIIAILHRRNTRLTASVLAALALAVCLIWFFRGGAGQRISATSFSLDENEYPVTESWTVRLEDPNNGTVFLYVGHDVISSGITVSINDVDKPVGVILTDPDGNEYYIPGTVEKDGNGMPVVVY